MNAAIANTVVSAHGLRKAYKNKLALDNTSFEIEAGKIIGLIGPNGAGKTTALKAILGLTPFEGQLKVLGLDPRKDRDELMKDVCFIADVAVLPRWMKVKEAIDFVAGVHPRFDRTKCERFIANTQLKPNLRVREMSKGMIVQLHLALVMAIDAKLLVLDEPTLGLDILYRKQFYQRLLEDYFDEQKTIIVTTHQVEEIEHILTDVMFIRDGRIVLTSQMKKSPSVTPKCWSAATPSTKPAPSSPSTSAPCPSARPCCCSTAYRRGISLPSAKPAPQGCRPVRRHHERNLRMNAVTSTLGKSSKPGAFTWLLKREFWENRGGFFWAPVITAASSWC